MLQEVSDCELSLGALGLSVPPYSLRAEHLIGRTWPPSVPGVLPVAMSQLLYCKKSVGNRLTYSEHSSVVKAFDHMMFRDTLLMKSQ